MDISKQLRSCITNRCYLTLPNRLYVILVIFVPKSVRNATISMRLASVYYKKKLVTALQKNTNPYVALSH